MVGVNTLDTTVTHNNYTLFCRTISMWKYRLLTRQCIKDFNPNESFMLLVSLHTFMLHPKRRSNSIQYFMLNSLKFSLMFACIQVFYCVNWSAATIQILGL